MEEKSSSSSRSLIFQAPGIFNLYSDGTVDRLLPVPTTPPSHLFVDGVATKDLILDATKGVWVRIFLPQKRREKRLPVVLYAHGGAFCTGDPSWALFHDFCHRMALKSEAIWVSLNYRLAPEHRLPAAYEDGCLAFRWLRSQAEMQANGTGAEPWLDQFGDFSRLFLAGESAGGAVVFNVAMRISEEDREPVNVCGLLLVHPAFHTEAKRESMMDDDGSARTRAFYSFALPVGADLDHPLVNPLVPQAPSLNRLLSYPLVVLAVAEVDFRYDLTMKFFETVRAICENVHLIISRDQVHAFHLLDTDCEEALQLEQDLAAAICRNDIPSRL
eukprot:c22773_g1_i2 orf=86-1075(+)